MVAIPILLVIFGFVGFIVKWAMDHEQEKLRIMAGKANQDTMTESELRRMIEDAVEEAIAPLRERLKSLEPSDAAQLHESESRPLLDVFEEEDAAEPAPKARTRRRV